MLFIILAIILVLFLIAFVLFLLFIKRMDNDVFSKLVTKKIKRIAKRNNLPVLNNVDLLNYDRDKLSINHVMFGKKYVYLITEYLLKGRVSGDELDNSWVYLNSITKKHYYLNNLNAISNKNIKDFAGILQISTDPIIAISLIPNECDFKIKNNNETNKFIVHYSSLRRKIKQLEKRDIASLKEEQIYEQYRRVKEKNEERN